MLDYYKEECASKEEMYFTWWIAELQQAGIITGWEFEPENFRLSEPVEHNYIKQLKTKAKDCVETVLREHIYTPDFKVYWGFDGAEKFITHMHDVEKINSRMIHILIHPITYIEIKPKFDKHNMTRLFKINQKWVFEKYGRIVSLVKPIGGKKCFFARTFTPKRYLTCDKTDKARKIDFPVRTLKEFLSE